MFKIIKIISLSLTLGASIPEGYCSVPDEIQLQWPQVPSPYYSVSQNGQTFGILRQGGGKTFVRFQDQTVELPAIPEAETSNAHPAQDWEHVHINPDGKYIINIIKGELVIRNLPTGETIWRGVLEGIERPSYGIAYSFDSAAKQFLLVLGHRLFKFKIDNNGMAKKSSDTPISFVPEGHSKWGNFVHSATFSADGRFLFIGNMDGEVLSIRLDSEPPTLQWRVPVFGQIKAGGFDDEASRYVKNLACADSCGTLLATATRGHQVALLDAATGKIITKKSGNERYRVFSVGQGHFFMSVISADRRTETRTIADSAFRPVMPIPLSSMSDAVIFGFKDGFASIAKVAKQEKQSIRFTYVAELLDKHRQRLAAQQRLQAQLPDFRRKLRSGDDSHCGLVIERKGNIALVETIIGQKWLKISQLHQPGARSCTFFNNVLQD